MRPDNLNVTIEAQITDNTGVTVAGLTFWQDGTAKYYTVPMMLFPRFIYRALKQKPSPILLTRRMRRAITLPRVRRPAVF
ncbi:MAG: hypothetical protein HY747_08780 [Elusimicrobia bacterium]|nr:hypothetical protein [Elusimicrobiota bacterium]